MSDNQTVYLTAEGLKKVEEELDHLINVRRPEVARQIAEAKAEGDLRENAGYDEAKNAQGFLEGRIQELKGVLKHVHLIEEESIPKNIVAIAWPPSDRSCESRSPITSVQDFHFFVDSVVRTKFRV